MVFFHEWKNLQHNFSCQILSWKDNVLKLGFESKSCVLDFFTLFTHEKTESVLNFRSDSLTQSECAVHSRTLKADLIISFHIFFFLCFFQVCAVMLQLYPCLFSLQNQILIELKWEILSYWYAKWRIWVSWSAASELSWKLYLILPL